LGTISRAAASRRADRALKDGRGRKKQEKDMTKQQVIDVIKKNIVENLDDIKAADIDPMKSMADYGANSLDIIEVVSCTMRELNIKIPRAELTDIKNIDQLADRFVQHMSQGPQA
jgi:polyketide biosynthesis acyl carrier protein